MAVSLEKRNLEALVTAPARSAGASVAYSGKIASVFHPSLTCAEVKDLVDNVAGHPYPHLPSYMVADGGRVEDFEAYDTKDGKWRMWLPWPMTENK